MRQSRRVPYPYQRVMPMRQPLILAVVAAAVAALAPAAQATFHLMKIREFRAGASPFVELQMYAPGQNLTGGHDLTVYNAGGALSGAHPLANVAGGESQRSILIAPGAVDGVAPDITAALAFDGTGGAVCFDTIDCVSYGAFTGGALPSPVSDPVTGYPTADPSQSLTRSIARGCATLLEATDDTDDSAADFAIDAPTPRNNATAPTETACGGGSGGSGDSTPPETRITRAPKKRSERSHVKVAFESSEPGSSFRCKLDRGQFERCRSPFKARVKVGRHRFQVFAIDRAGNRDQAPANAKFRRLAAD